MKLKLALLPLVFVSLIAATQDDWTPVTTKEGSLTLKFPAGWILADENDPKFKENREKIARDNPKMAEMMKPRTDDAQILMMYDMNATQEDGLATSMNVLKKSIPGLTVKMYGDLGKQILATLPQQKGKSEYKTIDVSPVGKTLRYNATIEMKVEASTVTMDLVGYIFLKGEHTYITTFTAAEGKGKGRMEAYEKILKTAKLQ